MAPKLTVTGPKRRSTRQRAIILDIVQRSHEHPDADRVYRIARSKIRNLSLGTVYRNLGFLVDEGLIREVHLPGSPTRYDGMLESHEHFVCSQCGRITDLPENSNATLLQGFAQRLPGAAVHSYRLDFFGTCDRCSG